MTLFFEYFMAVNVILYGWGVGIEKKIQICKKNGRKTIQSLFELASVQLALPRTCFAY